MGLRLRKIIPLGGGIRLNLSKRGASLSLGGRGLTVNLGKGGARTTLGAPGTGVSYSSYTPYRTATKGWMWFWTVLLALGALAAYRYL